MGEGRLKANKHRLVSWRKGNEEYRDLADVNVQDQTTDSIDIKINFVLDDTIKLAVAGIVDSYDITLDTGHGVVAGDKLAILEQNGAPQIYYGKVLSMAGDVATMDTSIPYAFDPVAATVLKYDDDLSVDGSVTPQTAFIANFFHDPVDITRFILHITSSTSMDDGRFGGLPELLRGVVLRKLRLTEDYKNYWNIKNNGEFGELAYDKTYDAKAPAGVYGVTVRATYGGQSKHGVVIRLEPGEQIQILIQDDLTDLVSFTTMVQGHVTE